jgi:toxin ParE1/3/4
MDAIFEFIANENPRAARGVIREVRSRVAILREYPEAGPTRADLGPGVRMLPVPHRAVVAYVIGADRVEIVRVFYAGQDYEAILRGGPDE